MRIVTILTLFTLIGLGFIYAYFKDKKKNNGEGSDWSEWIERNEEE